MIFKLTVLLILLPLVLLSQPLSQVTIYGVVTDSLSGEALAGVFVEVINEANSIERASGFTDANGNYQLNLATDIKSQQDMGRLPSEFALFQNYPNPFNPGTRIQFQIPWQTQVRLTIYNMLGQKVRTLLDRELGQDIYTVDWDGTTDAGNGVAAGIYFYQLRTPDYVETRKMVLVDGHGGQIQSFSNVPLQSNTQSDISKNICVIFRVRSGGGLILKEETVMVSSGNQEYNLDVLPVTNPFNRELISVSEPGDMGLAYIAGFPGAINRDMAASHTVEIINHPLDLHASSPVNADGSFAPLTVPARSENQISIALFNNGQPVSDPESLVIPESGLPSVLYSKPVNGDKDIILDVIIMIQFSEPVDTTTVNQNSFYLQDSSDNLVPGSISFLESDKKAVYTPIDSLEYYADYTIVVTNEVTDLQGDTLSPDYFATFKTKPREINFTKYPGNPIMSSGNYPAWDAAYIASPSVVYDDHQYHMFYNGNNPFLYNWAIGHATSSDGITWTKDSLNNPVLTAGSPGSWDDESVLVSSVLITGSTFHLWYTGVQTGNIYWKIGYAWSNDGGITWEKWNDPSTTNPPYDESDPVLDVGPTGSWDWRTVKSPDVILESDTFKMWYVGNRSTYEQSIGYAWSNDGIEWTKDTLHNPVLTPGTSYCWDVRGVDEPCVVFDGAFYHMFYMGGLMYTDHQIGYAWSADGINWEKYDNPYTTEWPYRISDPVLKSGPYGSWEFFWVGDPWVMLTGQPGELRIWYTGYYNSRQFGYATGIMDPVKLIQSMRKR